MKTRNFTTAALFFLTVGLTEGATLQHEKDSASVLAYAATGNSRVVEISAPVSTNKTESSAFNLENWITDREAWEQEGAGFEKAGASMETENLLEWVSDREAWEQESDTNSTYLSETVSLEEWITGRESWEQEGMVTEKPGFAAVSDFLGKWTTDRDNWEQK